MRVAYQGEPGAYGEEAIIRFFARPVDPIPVPTFSAVCDTVSAGRADAGVLPLENSVAGTVGDALDALASGSLAVIGEVLQPVNHHLLVVRGTRLADVRQVTSHWQALSQCHRFLSDRDWQLVTAADTAGAARQVADGGDTRVAAIASERAATLYDLEVAARDIQDSSHNVTRFAVIAPAGSESAIGDTTVAADGATGPRETLITFETGHQPGDLVRALSVLAAAGINLSRIESRPSGEEPWRYRFLIQVSGDAAADPLREALNALRAHTREMRILGSFAPG